MAVMSNKPKKPKVNLTRVFVVIAAADLGFRTDASNMKQLIEVDGASVIERTLLAFQKFSSELAKAGTTLRAIVVTNEDFVYKVNGICRYKKFEFVQNVVSGGETRMESVWKGIEALADLPFPPTDNDIVFIHDGSRCLIDEDTLERCLENAIQYEIIAAAVPNKNAKKEEPEVVEEPKVEEPKVEEAPAPAPVEEPKKSALGLDYSKFPALSQRLGFSSEVSPIARATEKPIEEPAEPKPIFKPIVNKEEPAPAPGKSARTAPGFKAAPEAPKAPAKDDSMEIQTPQAFRFDKLLRVYVNGIKRGLDVSNDTELAEALNFKVHLVDGSYNNIKVTTLDDAEKAEEILKRMAEEQKES